MATLTVEVIAAGRIAGSIAIDLLRAGICVVLVLVVPEVLVCHTAFVTTIAGYSRPSELER